MTVRCKFQLSSIKQSASSSGKTYEFTPQYDETIPEDQKFSKYTPSGLFTMWVDNPPVEAQFELGKQYYFDITPATP